MSFCLTTLYLCALSIPPVPPFIEISIDHTFINSTYALSNISTSGNIWDFDYCVQIERGFKISPLTAYAENTTMSFLSVEFSQISPIMIANNGEFTRYYNDGIEPAVNYMNGRIDGCTEYINYTISDVPIIDTSTTSDPGITVTSHTQQTFDGMAFCLVELYLCALSMPPVAPFIEISIDHTFTNSTYAISSTSENVWNLNYCIQIDKGSTISPLTVYSEDTTTSYLYVEFGQMEPIIIENNGDFIRYYNDESEPAVNYRNGRIGECIEYIKYTVSGIDVSTTSDTDGGNIGDKCIGLLSVNIEPFSVVEKICTFCFESSGSNEKSCLSLTDSGRVGWFLERKDCFMEYCKFECGFDQVELADGVTFDNLEEKCSVGCELFLCPLYNPGKAKPFNRLMVNGFVMMLLPFM